MSVALITGSSGLIGSETARFFHEKGLEVVGIDNNLRQYFFGKDGSVRWNTENLKSTLRHYTHFEVDIRNKPALDEIFKKYAQSIQVIIHTAAQPSHDWAAKEPLTDFSVNAMGTLNLLECFRQYCPSATFIFCSTNKVYGDTPNALPMIETPTRWELASIHPYAMHGIDESMSIDHSKHSLFGVSKAAADLMVQEYGRYFGFHTGVFRGGCLTGPAHSGAELHGFLSYLVKCVVQQRPYKIFGYKGKQVRDNIHSFDLVNAFWHFYESPKSAAVYNMGGSRHCNCSVLEALQLTEELANKKAGYEFCQAPRSGDHIWWISDVRKFQKDFPHWKYRYNLKAILEEIIEASQTTPAIAA